MSKSTHILLFLIASVFAVSVIIIYVFASNNNSQSAKLKVTFFLLMFDVWESVKMQRKPKLFCDSKLHFVS